MSFLTDLNSEQGCIKFLISPLGDGKFIQFLGEEYQAVNIAIKKKDLTLCSGGFRNTEQFSLQLNSVPDND